MISELEGTKQICWRCGKRAELSRFDIKPGLGLEKSSKAKATRFRCYCKECFKIVQQEEHDERQEYIRLKKREMFRKACNTLENQNVDMYKYKDAIDAVEEKITEAPDKFDSSYEVLTAIILVHNCIYSKMQYRIGDYQVDFFLPDDKVILEIDGERHSHRKGYDSIRDEYIRRTLGEPWQIIRIPTSLLDKHADRIPEAIQKVLVYRSVGKVDWRKLYM